MVRLSFHSMFDKYVAISRGGTKRHLGKEGV